MSTAMCVARAGSVPHLPACGVKLRGVVGVDTMSANRGFSLYIWIVSRDMHPANMRIRQAFGRSAY